MYNRELGTDMLIAAINNLNDTLAKKAIAEMYVELLKSGVISRQQYVKRMHGIIDFKEEL